MPPPDRAGRFGIDPASAALEGLTPAKPALDFSGERQHRIDPANGVYTSRTSEG
jgi:hypothetical protein